MTINAVDVTMRVGPGGVLIPSVIYATYTTGVAPLGVHVSINQLDGDSTFSKQFDTHYAWNYGDTGSGTHETGQSRNESVGPTGGHVYDTPGNYTITLTRTTAAGAQPPLTIDITVDDPDGEYPTTSTVAVCKVASNDFTGAPAGADEQTTDDPADIVTWLNQGKRVLLRRGDTWTLSNQMTITADDCYLGAYGTGTGETAQGSFANDPVFDVDAALGIAYWARADRQRITHINFQGVDQAASPGDGLIKASNAWPVEGMVIYRCQSLYHNMGVVISGGPVGIQNLSVAENRWLEGNEYNFFASGDRAIVIGNLGENPGSSHNHRMPSAYQVTFNCNILKGASIDNSLGRHALKFNSRSDTQNPERRETKYGTIWGNVVGAGGSDPFLMGPGSDGRDQLVSYMLVEGNRFYSGYGTQSSVLVKVGMSCYGSYNMIRNNVVDGGGGFSNWKGIRIAQRGAIPAVDYGAGAPVPIGNAVYNNTIVNTDINTISYGVWISDEDTQPEDTIVINNYTDVSAAATNAPLLDNGINTTASNNIEGETLNFVDSINVDYLLRDYNVTVGSDSIDAGTNVNVWVDYEGTTRPFNSTYDVGAYEYDG